jgi:aspartate racemase
VLTDDQRHVEEVSETMKHIGLMGGLSPESTVSYYQLICAGFNKQAGGLSFPTITVRSVNLQQLVDLFNADRWNSWAHTFCNGRSPTA